MRDPIEQARIDFAAGRDWPPERFAEEWEAWGDEGFRLYLRELRALEPAEGPLPWTHVSVLLVLECAMAECMSYIERRSRRWWADLLLTPAFVPLGQPVMAYRKRAGREAARRRGVTRVGEGPPEEPSAPRIIISVGAVLGIELMRRRGVRWPRGSGATTVLAGNIVREWEIRRRWRSWSRRR